MLACGWCSTVFNVSNMIDNPASFVSFAEELADEARRMFPSSGETAPDRHLKPDSSYVTTLDLAIERRLRHMIESRYREHGILGEEEAGTRLDADWVWVLDPVDGTAPFIAGIPVYGTLIALAHRGRPCLGVIDFPATQDRWIGVSGQISLHNGHACTTRKGLAIENAMQCTMNPDFFSPHEKQALDRMKALTIWRIYGGSAFSYGRLASGTLDIALDTNLKVHDYAAFVPIIQGAGGVITDWEGQPLTLSSGPRVLAAGDAALHHAALIVIRNA
jgi:inositol-phosphate phosphatase / L-galactose 1-phosphate phosphatase / histidinol-phosphatase